MTRGNAVCFRCRVYLVPAKIDAIEWSGLGCPRCNTLHGPELADKIDALKKRRDELTAKADERELETMVANLKPRCGDSCDPTFFGRCNNVGDRVCRYNVEHRHLDG